MLKAGQQVKINYAGQLEDGYEFVNTWLMPDPVTVEIGNSGLLPAFERELVTMTRGTRKKFKIPCALAYGAHDPSAVITIPAEGFPHADELPVGAYIEFDIPGGRARAKVLAADTETLTFDCNHELAGHDLTFEVELVDDGTVSVMDQEMGATGCNCDRLRKTLSGDDEIYESGCNCC